jgi:eukaryotic-like serine/threonine-protein kinase
MNLDWICHNCGANWSQGQYRPGCPQCGGGALERACPLCHGRCGRRWQRAVLDSWDFNLAHWAGGCGLAPLRDRSGQKMGHYRLDLLMELGGAIDRYLGSDVPSQRPVSVLSLSDQTDEAGLLRFQRNLPLIKRLVHPHIAPVLDAGVENRRPFVVLDRLPTIRDSHEFPLPVSTVVRFVSQLADAFDSAHSQGVWHTYTSPETIVFRDPEVLLAGFSLRLLEISQEPQDPGDLWNLPVPLPYLPPEQVSHSYSIDASIDQYALAAVVYEWLCGAPPFHGADPLQVAIQIMQHPPPPLREKAPMLPPALEPVIARALAKKPAERFPTIRAFSDALAEASEKRSSN